VAFGSPLSGITVAETGALEIGRGPRGEAGAVADAAVAGGAFVSRPQLTHSAGRHASIKRDILFMVTEHSKLNAG
jgi:hypothetical protein